MQQELDMPFAPTDDTAREREGWVFVLTEREIALLRQPVAPSSGGWQSTMREAATRIYPDRTWRVSDDLMLRLFRMCVKQGKHGGYQRRMPMRVLSPVFSTMTNSRTGVWFYGRYEAGDNTKIKIGVTVNHERRHRDHSTDNPRKLNVAFRIWDPSGEYESRFKRHFHRYCISGEWFACVPEVRNFVALCEQVKTTSELPPLT